MNTGWTCHKHGNITFPRCPKCADQELRELKSELKEANARTAKLGEALKTVLARSTEKEILQKAKYFGVDEEYAAGALWLSKRIRAYLKGAGYEVGD